LVATAISVALAAGLLAAGSGTAGASTVAPQAQPPKGYPSGQVVYSFKDPSDGLTTYLRHGYYDSTKDEGFGWDKVWNKHGITDYRAVRAILESPSRFPTSTGKDTVNHQEYAYAEVNGKVTQEILVTAVYEFGNWPDYNGWPAGAPLGVMTMFCDNSDKSAQCPSWVTTALINVDGQRIAAPSASATAPTGQPPITSYFALDHQIPTGIGISHG